MLSRFTYYSINGALMYGEKEVFLLKLMKIFTIQSTIQIKKLTTSLINLKIIEGLIPPF